MLISRKVTEISEISHVNLRAGWKELIKPINRSNFFRSQHISCVTYFDDVINRDVTYFRSKDVLTNE